MILDQRGNDMVIGPMRTEADHEAAVSRIEELWGCQSGTPEGDELEVLIKLAWAYENEHHKIEAPSPESLLEYRLDQIGLPSDDIDQVMAFRKKAPEILQKESGFSTEIISIISAIHLDVDNRHIARQK